MRGRERCQCHVSVAVKRAKVAVHAASRRQAKATLQALGQTSILASEVFRFSSAPNKLAIAEAALEATQARDPRILDAAFNAAKAKLAWRKDYYDGKL